MPSKVDRFTLNQDQTDPRPFYSYRRIHFTSENASFCVIIFNYRGGPLLSQQPPGRAPRVTTQANRFVYASELIETIVNRTLLI